MKVDGKCYKRKILTVLLKTPGEEEKGEVTKDG